MTSTHDGRRGLWGHLIGFLLENKLVVGVLLAVLVGAGVYVSPFAIGGGARDPIPVDAIPDIGENQQIVFTTWPGRSPKDIEDQITYPLTTSLLGIPGVRTIRSTSLFGFSSIYVIFEDGVEFYWSRSRLLEKLSSLPGGTLPDGVSPMLGPDATALGQVFWYTLEGRDRDGGVTSGWDLHELRSIQDWTVRYALQSVPGVAEVASVGGYVKEYQVDVDSEAMRAHGVSLQQVAAAVAGANLDTGARTIEINNVEYVLRGLGFVRELADLEQAVVAVRDNVPVRVRDVAHVAFGPAERRGALDKGGAEAVGGIVVVRFGENPLAVIERVKDKINEVAPGLPRRVLEDGRTSQVTVVPFYDRTTLIQETLGTLSTALLQQILITILVVLVMLRHVRSSLLISATLPLGVLVAFVAMKWLGVDANVMSLAGIAIAIGTMVDMGIVFTENIVAQLDRAPPGADRLQVIRRAAAEVAPAVLTSTATTIVSFLPVFALTASEGKLFRPLAFTKSFALAGAFFVALAVIPPVAHLILGARAGRAAPAVTRRRRLARSLFRPAHLRDWAFVLLGAAIAALSVWVGLLLMLVGAVALARPLLPPRLVRLAPWVENGLPVVVVTWVLAADWMPMGAGRAFALSLGFVVGAVALLLGGFLLFQHSYERILRWALAHKLLFLSAPAVVLLFGATAWLGFDRVFGWIPEPIRMSRPVTTVAHALPGFGREFMPPFDEGSYLYMPTTMPHASIGQAIAMLKELDARIQAIPEVEDAVGKLGRAESPLDPAPVSMFETVITYKPEYRIEADGTRVRQWREQIHGPDDIWKEIVLAAELLGVTSAPKLMPIATRIVMLQSGMRAPMGIKVRGPDLESIERAGIEIEALLRQVPSIRAETVYADRVVGKPYIEIELDREAMGRFGLSVREVQEVIQVALGGRALTRTVEGRERYPVRVRYMREERDSVEALRRVMVPAHTGQQIPLEQVTRQRYVRGPQMIKSEDTFLTGYVTFDKVADVAEVDVVEQARRFLADKRRSGELRLPAGVAYAFAGAYENQLRSEQRLLVLLPLALVLVFLLLYLQFRRVLTTAIIFSGVAVAIAGGFLLLWLYGQPWFLDVTVLDTSLRDLFQVGTINMSVAVWVGVIALIGIATDDGVVMATYLKQRFEQGDTENIAAVRQRTVEAGRRRVRACLMTTATTILALLPVLTSRGRGSDVMVPMAVPVLGGMAVELMTLFVVPVLYSWVEEKAHAAAKR